MAFVQGDLVHVAAIGKGTVREVRNNDRYLVDVKGRAIVTAGDQLQLQQPSGKRARPKAAASSHTMGAPSGGVSSIDLHGLTVAEALEAVDGFLNAAMLDGNAEAHIIHGRSGGRIKAALQKHLRGIRAIRSYEVDPRNEGVTIIIL